MVLKNREVRCAVAAGAILSAIGAAAAYGLTGMLLDGTDGTSLMLATTAEAARDTAVVSLQTSPRTVSLVAACCSLATGLIVTGVFTALTAIRYRALNDMAANLDRVLAGERDICLRDMREGELAILASEVDKVIARLNLTVDELQAEKLALSDALADISHQLKTPLTSIAISTELIRDRLAERGDAPEILERLRLVQRLQGRVEDLVAALLKLARIDAGVIKLVKAPVDARELVRKSFEPLAVAFDIAGVDFETSIQPGAGYEGDLAWSVEALENILKNCMEHTPAGGTVHVRTTEDTLACRIRIEDTGPGIDVADLPHVFERFYRGKRADAVESSEVAPVGVGIGLSLAKSLVAAQGGTLTADNARDASGDVTGAVFTLVFFKAIV